MAAVATEKSHKHKINDIEPTSKSERTKKKRKLETQSEASPAEQPAPETTTAGVTMSSSKPALKTAEISSPYTLTTASRYLSISPAYSATPQIGIQRDHLDPLVFKYDSTLDGVILLHQNLRFQSPAARILGESPFAFVWCLVEFMLWKPVVGMVLEGFVNNVSPSHLGMLYGNVFSVSVTQTGIPKDWKFVPANDDGASMTEDAEDETYPSDGKNKRKQKSIGGADPIEGLTKAMGRWFDVEGNEVEGLQKFVVTAVKTEGGMLSLEGSFKDEDLPEVAEGGPEPASIATEVPKKQIAQLHGRDSDDEESKRRRMEKKEKKKRKREGKIE
ncbi:hypothetical protein TWF730_002200 [Orbilia blumenaviensis]|uniref:DNA-directed RNA polymerase subunit n=1 Tax=Orbilia blumenaviensis TaxID=1796055 RepID=A0AAV9UD85_9PEZI